MDFIPVGNVGVGDHILLGAGSRNQTWATVTAVEHTEESSTISTTDNEYSFRPETSVQVIPAMAIN